MDLGEVFIWSAVAVGVGLLVAIVYYAHVRPWVCGGCGAKNRGAIGLDSFQYKFDGCICSHCAWEPLNKAKYNRDFGIPNDPPKSIK